MVTPIEAAKIAARNALKLAALHAALTADVGAIASGAPSQEKVTGGKAEIPDPVAAQVFSTERLHDRARDVEFYLSAIGMQSDACVRGAEATLRGHGLPLPYAALGDVL